MHPIHGTRILVVDDCSDTASLLCELLVLKGYADVSCTTNARAVRDLCRANHYDLILLDMHMPHLCGLHIMRGLHASAHGQRMPVIAMSGDSRYQAIAMTAGARGFLLKPFNHEEVEASIRDARGDASMAGRNEPAIFEGQGETVMGNTHAGQPSTSCNIGLPGLLPSFFAPARPSRLRNR